MKKNKTNFVCWYNNGSCLKKTQVQDLKTVIRDLVRRDQWFRSGRRGLAPQWKAKCWIERKLCRWKKQHLYEKKSFFLVILRTDVLSTNECGRSARSTPMSGWRNPNSWVSPHETCKTIAHNSSTAKSIKEFCSLHVVHISWDVICSVTVDTWGSPHTPRLAIIPSACGASFFLKNVFYFIFVLSAQAIIPTSSRSLSVWVLKATGNVLRVLMVVVVIVPAHNLCRDTSPVLRMCVCVSVTTV